MNAIRVVLVPPETSSETSWAYLPEPKTNKLQLALNTWRTIWFADPVSSQRQGRLVHGQTNIPCKARSGHPEQQASTSLTSWFEFWAKSARRELLSAQSGISKLTRINLLIKIEMWKGFKGLAHTHEHIQKPMDIHEQHTNLWKIMDANSKPWKNYDNR